MTRCLNMAFKNGDVSLLSFCFAYLFFYFLFIYFSSPMTIKKYSIFEPLKREKHQINHDTVFSHHQFAVTSLFKTAKCVLK